MICVRSRPCLFFILYCILGVQLSLLRDTFCSPRFSVSSLAQIFQNLMSNAVKFTERGGVTIQATYLKDGVPGDENRSPNKPMVKFVVKDTGMGICKEQQEVIFQKYQQANAAIARNFGGTGLGLSICRSLVQMMDGTMGLDSQEGNGSSFWFMVPAELPTEKELAGDDDDETEHNTSPEHGGVTVAQAVETGLNILVVEDNKVNQKMLANMLKRMGHKSTLAENGKEAIDLVERNPGGYSLVLMDIQMPVCDGLEATRRLRTMGYHDLPIYGLTASVARSDFEELGFNEWLTKPIRMKDLKNQLCRLRRDRETDQCHLLDTNVAPIIR